MPNQRLFHSKTFLAIIITLLGFFSWYSYHRIQEMIDSSNLVNHSNLVTLKIEEILSYTKDAETAQRGFIITRDSQFLRPSIGASERVSVALKSLDSLVQDNRLQASNFYKYRVMVLARFMQLGKARNYLLSKEYSSATLHFYLLEGAKVMDSVRVQAALMEKLEESLLAQRVQQNQSNILITPIITLTLSLSLLFLVIIAFLFIRSRYHELQKTKTELSDTTGQLKQTANELKESEEKFKGLFEHAPDAVVIVNHEGSIQIVNMQTEKMFGYEREELIGRKVEILIPEQLKTVHGKHRENYFADPKFREMGTDLELKGKRKDGSEFPVEISLSPLKTKDGILVTAAIRDITRRKKTEEDLKRTTLEVHQKNLELRRSNAQLESFNYIAGHDLREPLRKIQVFTGKILELESGNISQKGRDYFKRIENSSSHMMELIESLLNYSTLGKEGLKFTNIDLNDVVENVKKNLADVIEEKHATIYSEKLPVIFADPVQMYELISNLIGNSIKYSKENVAPFITITVSQSKNHFHGSERSSKDFLKISIKDNGIGFDASYKEKIFELFKRLHGKQDYPGTGIGLAICKKAAENHGGFITAESIPGEGATFHIYLPETLN